MSQQFQQPTAVARTQDVTSPVARSSARAAAAKEAYDAVLDEIDAALESDAEAFVKGFVQKGGQ